MTTRGAISNSFSFEHMEQKDKGKCVRISQIDDYEEDEDNIEDEDQLKEQDTINEDEMELLIRPDIKDLVPQS